MKLEARRIVFFIWTYECYNLEIVVNNHSTQLRKNKNVLYHTHHLNHGQLFSLFETGFIQIIR